MVLKAWTKGALALAVVILLLGRVLPALAEDDPAFIGLGVGYFDILQGDDTAVDFRLEYRHDEKLWIFKPWVGLEVTSDTAFYGGGGLLIDIFFGRRFVVTPSIGVGGYIDGDGKDLGSALEFRSQLEAGYRFNDRSRLSLAFSHLSNAGIGDDNPGVEVLTLYYHLPLSSLF